MVNVLLIGCGPHARRIYYPILEEFQLEGQANLCGLIDIEAAQPTIESFLSKRKIQPKEKLYLAPSDILPQGLSTTLQEYLDALVQKYHINAVIIATEPLYHVCYATWALEHGLNVLMDKPLSSKLHVSTSLSAADEILEDYEKLSDLYTKQKAKDPTLAFHLMAQRRYHPAFHKVKSLISEMFDYTNCPITSVQSFHSDGQWRMPLEILNQHYHPYNQGYGKCSHSGYHSLDIVPWLLEAAEAPEKSLDTVEIYTQFNRPNDFLAQLNPADYHKLFPDIKVFGEHSEAEVRQQFAMFGELDAFTNVSFYHDDQLITLGSVNLAHNGFSQRNWPTADGRDLYKGNGRVRHESHILEQGPFQAIYFQSYQSREISPNDFDEIYEVGGEYHLDIHVFRNNTLFPHWKAYEKISIRDLDIPIMEGMSRGHQEDARRQSVIELLAASEDKQSKASSDLHDHRRGIVLMHGIYKSAALRFNKQNPIVSLDFNK